MCGLHPAAWFHYIDDCLLRHKAWQVLLLALGFRLKMAKTEIGDEVDVIGFHVSNEYLSLDTEESIRYAEMLKARDDLPEEVLVRLRGRLAFASQLGVGAELTEVP